MNVFVKKVNVNCKVKNTKSSSQISDMTFSQTYN